MMLDPTATQKVVETAPDWLKIIGSGGIIGALALVGTFVSFLTKKQIAILEAENAALTRQNVSLEKEISQAKEAIDKAKDDLEEVFSALEKTRNNEFSDPNDAARMRRIIANLERYRDIQPTLKDYKIAANWLKNCKSDWVDRSFHLTCKKHPKLINFRKKNSFRTDISNYLNWVYDSLYVYGHNLYPITKFVDKPIIASAIPYTTAIQAIRDYLKTDFGNLTMTQTKYLDKMLNELIEKLPNKF